MLLLPVLPGSAVRLPAIAVDGDARLLGKGPLPGSLVVIGDRARFAGGVFGAGGLVLSAPAILCGDVAVRWEKA